MPTSSPDVSVVVVNFNAGRYLQRCLESLFEHSGPRLREVVVIDNASSDGSMQAIGNRWPNLHVISNRANVGLAAANNQGIEATSGDYIVICNPDIEFQNKAVDALADCLDRRPRAAIAGALLRTPEGRLHTCAGSLPTLGEAILGRAAKGSFWWNEWAHDEELAAGHVMEACYAVRRRAVAEVGLQDPAYFLDWEGIDWAARFGDAGWEVWFCPSAEVVHTGGVSIRQAPLRWVLRSHRSMYRYFRKRSQVPAPVLASIFGVRAALKGLWVIFRGADSRLPLANER